jgi:hypothetical protein
MREENEEVYEKAKLKYDREKYGNWLARVKLHYGRLYVYTGWRR